MGEVECKLLDRKIILNTRKLKNIQKITLRRKLKNIL